MDAQTFDRLLAAAARRPTRRSALRLLSAGLIAALLPASARAAQRSDRDNDGLFDDDETDVYGTDPDIPDTDGDTRDDGQEVFDGTNPLVNENAPPPAAEPAPAPPAATCAGTGGPCAAHSACCGYDTPNILCCFNADGAGTCTDVSVNSFLCPAPGVPTAGCPDRQIDCGGFCTDLMMDHGNCGFCGNRCSQVGPEYYCVAGTCTPCSAGLTDCGGVCVNLMNDSRNCGACGYDCGINQAGDSITGLKIPIGPIPCQGGICGIQF